MRFVHINILVVDPERSANFYQTYLLPNATIVLLGDSLHLRDKASDLAFTVGQPALAHGAHHGFVADSIEQIDRLAQTLRAGGVELTDDCVEADFRSIKFLDPDGYEIEVYWERDWP